MREATALPVVGRRLVGSTCHTALSADTYLCVNILITEPLTRAVHELAHALAHAVAPSTRSTRDQQEPLQHRMHGRRDTNGKFSHRAAGHPYTRAALAGAVEGGLGRGRWCGWPVLVVPQVAVARCMAARGSGRGGLSVVVGRCGDRELGRVACPILVTESDLR